MNDWLIYLGISTGILTTFLMGYYLLLKKDTHFSIRRGYILFSLLLALLIPFGNIPLTPTWQMEIPETLILQEEATPPIILPIVEEKSNWEPFQLTTWIYVAGCIFMLLRLAFLIHRVLKLILRSSPLSPKDHRVRVSEQIEAPFTFLSFILLPPRQENAEDREVILAHEKIHIEKKHYLDLLLFELFLCFQWMNPALWLFRKELKEVHEYEADHEVLRTHTNKKKYQLTVLKYAVGNQKFALASAFNQLQTLKRIHMMNKKRSSSWNRMKVLGLIPIGILCLLLNSAFHPQTNLSITYEDELTITGMVLDASSLKPLVGAAILLKGSRNGTVTDKKGKFYLTIPKNSSKVLVFTSLENVPYEVALTQSGELAVFLSNNGTNNSHQFVAGKMTGISSHENIMEDVFDKSGNGSPLVMLDGEKTSQEKVKNLTPDEIAFINVVKGEKAKEKYGEEGKNGVVEITTKDAESASFIPSPSKEGEDPLIIIDGKVSERTRIEGLDPDEIEKIEVLKGDSAVEQYGEKARNGVIVVTKKK